MKLDANLFDLFGLEVNRGKIELITESILEDIDKDSRTLVVTPNSDHFIRWCASQRFREIYSRAQYRLIDGAPLLWIARMLGGSDVHRITGVDLTIKLLQISKDRSIPIAIIGGTCEAMEQAVFKIEQGYPGIRIFLKSTPSQIDLNSEDFLQEISLKLGCEKFKLVLICLGSPKQEDFFYRLDDLGDGTGIYLCVGGAIDFLAGFKLRAPHFIQKLGLEWLYRFAQEPVRLFRRYFINNPRIFKYILKAFIIKTLSILKCFRKK